MKFTACIFAVLKYYRLLNYVYCVSIMINPNLYFAHKDRIKIEINIKKKYSRKNYNVCRDDIRHFSSLTFPRRCVGVENDNFKAFRNDQSWSRNSWNQVQSGNFNRRSRDKFFAPSSIRFAIAARKNFDLPYMLLNSDESNFPRLPGEGAR